MTDPKTPTPAEIAAIIAELPNRKYYMNCGLRFVNIQPRELEVLLACAERGLAPPSGEVQEMVRRIEHVGKGETLPSRKRFFEEVRSLLLRLSAPPVAAGEATCKDLLQVQPSGEAAPLEGEGGE